MERNHQPFVFPVFERRRRLIGEGEPGSSGGFGSCTLILTSVEVRPLYRCGSRGTFAPAMRKSAEGAARVTAASCGREVASAATTSSSVPHDPSQRQLS